MPWSRIPAGTEDIRLVVADMDGTLLNENGEASAAFWELLQLMGRRGITFVPASGRQYATLKNQFGFAGNNISYIAENGAMVVHGGKPVSVKPVDTPAVHRIIDAARRGAKVRDLGLVLCGVKSAYVERHDTLFIEECDRYYAQLEHVDDLAKCDDQILKCAIFDFEDSQEALDTLFVEVSRGYQTVLSGKHWMDIMRKGINKGQGIALLQETLGVTRNQTVTFGDYLNDYEMMSEATWSFAMANAHPKVVEVANYLAPSNVEDGVTQVLKRLLGVDEVTFNS